VITPVAKDLESIVETGGIADSIFECVEPFPRFKVSLNIPLACLHPPPVRADRVDFAVVRDIAERLRHRPAGLRVRRVALMKNGKGRAEGFNGNRPQSRSRVRCTASQEEAFLPDELDFISLWSQTCPPQLNKACCRPTLLPFAVLPIFLVYGVRKSSLVT
jgi:hypothetical protein